MSADQSKHTPGPWRSSNGTLVRVFAHGSDRPICGVHRRGQFSFGEDPGETAANARLIAAAPDLLAALRLAREALPTPDSRAENEVFKTINTAIDKAEGVTESASVRDVSGGTK